MNASRAGVWAAAVLAAAAAAGSAGAQSLKDVLDAAYRRSPDLAAERAQLEAVNERVPQALAATRPTVSLNATEGTVHERSNSPVEPVSIGAAGGGVTGTGAGGAGTTSALDQGYFPTDLPRSSYGVTINQSLYRGGQTLAQFRQARALVAAERQKLAEVEGEVLLRAASDYADLLQAQEALELSQRRVDTLTGDVTQAQGRYKGGALTRTDLAQSEAARADALGQKAQALLALARARAAIVRDTAMEVTRPEPASVIPTGLPTSRDEAVRLAQDAAPASLSARYTAEAAGQQVRAAQGQALPSLGVQGVLEHQQGTNFRGEKDDIEAVILQLRVPIYSGGALASQTRAARKTAEARRDQADKASQDAAYAAEDAWAQLESAEAAESAYAAQAQINAVALTGVRLEESTGERTIQDILVADLTLYQSRLKLSQARHDLLVARFALAAATGVLNARTVGLAAPYYNPEDAYRQVRFGPGR